MLPIKFLYAQLVEEESTRTVMAGLREVIERTGLFCALYSDRASHFFVTPKAGEPVDKSRLTQVGLALKELGVQMIPAYSPQARGRSERSFGTWHARLPQELRLAAITTLDGANRFLRERYIAAVSGPPASGARPGTGMRFIKLYFIILICCSFLEGFNALCCRRFRTFRPWC